jgi:hypothetical protein
MTEANRLTGRFLREAWVCEDETCGLESVGTALLQILEEAERRLRGQGPDVMSSR